MRINEHIPGNELKQFTFHSTVPIKGAAVLIHGHGDYSARYESILEPFLERGISCVSTDLPGHGDSPGKRGFIPGLDTNLAIQRANLARARELCPDGPIGLFGHSAGGLLALRELLHHREDYQFSWFSSPLLRPSSSRHPITVWFLRLVARFFPNIALATGVSAKLCRHFDSPEDEQNWAEGAFHIQIRLGWGFDLLSASKEVAQGYPPDPPTLPILFTQGSADPVCEAGFLREFLESTNFPAATYIELKDQLHEPFIDTAHEEVRLAIGNWIAQVLGKEQ